MNYSEQLRDKIKRIKESIKTESQLVPVRQIKTQVKEVSNTINNTKNAYLFIKSLYPEELKGLRTEISSINSSVESYNLFISKIKQSKTNPSLSRAKRLEDKIYKSSKNVDDGLEKILDSKIEEILKKINNLKDLETLMPDQTQNSLKKNSSFFNTIPCRIDRLSVKIGTPDARSYLSKEYLDCLSDLNEISNSVTSESISEEYEISKDTISLVLDLMSGNEVFLKEISTQQLEEISQSTKLNNKVALVYG